MEKDNRVEILKSMKISKAIGKMAVPAIISFLVIAIYNFVDTIFISWISPTATGATQVMFVLDMFVTAIGVMFGAGTATYASRLLGKDKHEKASSTISSVLSIVIIVGILVTIFGLIFLDQLLRLGGATESLLGLSRQYGFYIVAAYSITIVNIYLNNVLRGEGSAKQSMISMLVGAVIKIALDPLFIFTFDWGITGAALATVASQLITFAILMYIYLKKKSVLQLSVKLVSHSKEMWKQVMKIGLPAFATQFLLSFSMSLLNNYAGIYGGDNAIAAMGMVMKVVLILMYVIIGFGMGFQPVVGYNYGAGNKKRVLGAMKFALKFALIYSVICFVIINIFGQSILTVFRPTDAVMENAWEFLRYFSFSIVLLSLINTTAVFYQSIGKGAAALFIAFARQGVFLVPILMIVPKYLGLTGVLIAQPVADLLLIFFVVPMLISSIRKIKCEGIEASK